MRVLFVETTVGFGGSSKSMLELVQTLSDVVPFAVTSVPLSEYSDVIPATHVAVVALQVSSSAQRAGSIGAYMALLRHVQRWTQTIARVVRQQHIDVIHANNGLSLNLAAILAARLCRVPLVVHQRGWEERTMRSRLARRLLGSTRVIAISQAVAQDLAHCGVSQDSVVQIYDVVAPPSAPPAVREMAENRRCRIGMHGMLTSWKGHRTFIHAAAKLHRLRPNAFEFCIAGTAGAGEESYAQSLADLVGQLQLSDVVRFDGHVHDIYGWLNEIDISVHASTTPEPLGRVIVEAQLAARPVIAARGGGANELIDDGINGLLVAAGDPSALAHAISQLTDDAQLRERVVDAALQSARVRFDRPTLAAQVHDVYRSLDTARAQTTLVAEGVR